MYNYFGFSWELRKFVNDTENTAVLSCPTVCWNMKVFVVFLKVLITGTVTTNTDLLCRINIRHINN